MMEEPKAKRRLRSIDIFKIMSARQIWRLIRGVFRTPVDRKFAGHPLAVCWFTNFSCNADCHFCCKAAEIKEGKNRFPPLELDDAKRLLAKIRESVNLLYLSGGEPTVHPHIVEILKEAKNLEFTSIGISSNLIVLDKRIEVLDYVDAIGVSIHSPDVEQHAANLGVPVKLGQKVFENLELIKSHPRNKDINVLINCVINEKNIDSIMDMVEFTAKHGFLLELVPANGHGDISGYLAKNADYRALIDKLISMRKSGEAPHLAGSTGYYKRLRSLKPFRCFPYGAPNIMPDGRLCTPCDISGQYSINVLDFPNLKRAVRASRKFMGEYPCKKGKCFKAGIVERSRLYGALIEEYSLFPV